MTHVPYASAVGSLMYAMVYTQPGISQAVSMVSRYMHDPSKSMGCSEMNFAVHKGYYGHRICVCERSPQKTGVYWIR